MQQRKTTLTLLLSALLWFSMASAQDLTYTFADDKLTGPETISANSFQNISFNNNSDVELDVTVTKIHDGTTLDELVSADQTLSATFSGEGDARQAMSAFIALTDVIGGVHQNSRTEANAYLRLEPSRASAILAHDSSSPERAY